MKSLGIDRMIWSTGASAEEIKELNRMDNVLTSRYDIYQDVMDPAKFSEVKYVHDFGRGMLQPVLDVPPQIEQFQVNPALRLPLWELVYHDCVVAFWYWGDYNNKIPKVWRKRDLFNALYGTPPMYMFNRKGWEENKMTSIMHHHLSRRRFLASCTAATALFADRLCSSTSKLYAAEKQARYRIGICDWDLRATGNPNSLAIGKELGFDGVEVSYQPDGEFTLSQASNRRLFLEAAEKNKIAISSLAMGVLNDRPLATIPDAESWVADCIDAMVEMDVPIVLLAFFGKGDIKNDTNARTVVTEKLKRLAQKAEQHGKILGIESYLNAEEHLEMLRQIGSNAVKVYYDPQNMLTKKYSIYEDMKILLEEKAICQIHVKEYNARLGAGKIDFPRIFDMLAQFQYPGQWTVVESSVRGDWKESQTENMLYLKKNINN